MTTSVIDLVRPYAEAVRAALLLPADLVEELTDGLEADLVAALEDRMAQGGTAAPDAVTSPDGVGSEATPAAPDADAAPTTVLDPVAVFGPPEVYAAELRAAAGIGEVPAPPEARPRLRTRVRTRWAARRDRLNAAISAQPWWPPVEDFLLAMRPVWWALRGWVLFGVVSALLSGMIPTHRGVWVAENPLRWALLVALIVLSAQWGRGRLARGRWRDRIAGAANLLAVVLLIPAIVTSTAPRIQYVETWTGGVPPEAVAAADGVWVDGMQVSNLFVYDAEGTLLLGAQVFDDRGREVRTVTESDSEWYLPGVPEPWQFLPVVDGEKVRWNVYPLRGAPVGSWTWDTPGPGPVLLPGVDPQLPPPPFALAPRVPDAWFDADPAETVGGGSGDEAPGPSPSTTPSPSDDPDDATSPTPSPLDDPDDATSPTSSPGEDPTDPAEERPAPEEDAG